MSEENKKTAEIVPVLIEAGVPILKNTSDIVALAKWVNSMQMAPKGFDSPQKVALGIMFAQSLGLHPLLSLGQMFILNGVPNIYGDLPLSLVRRSGLLADFKEEYLRDKDGNIIGARCTSKRGEMVHTTEFTIEDAKTAGLWGKAGPWKQYPKRMLKLRTRSENLKDQFGDILQGIPIMEYDGDRVEKEVGPKQNTAGALESELMGEENGEHSNDIGQDL